MDRASTIRSRRGLGALSLPIERWRVACLVVVLAMTGCAHSNYVSVRRVPRNPLADSLQLFSWHGPQPTARTEQLLRRYDLATPIRENPPVALAGLEKEIATEPSPDKFYSFAELAYINGQKAQSKGEDLDALDYYGQALGHAYHYLFDQRLDLFRNPYDPQFRQACDLYNGALEAALRIVRERKKLQPGTTERMPSRRGEFELTVELRGPWKDAEVERLEFASDYQVDGLTNQYRTYGLGVPVIAVRRKGSDSDPAERYYPRGLCFPLTAFLRVHEPRPEIAQASEPRPTRRFVLELHDPLNTQHLQIENRLVPLETDLSTALGYFLDSPELKTQSDATLGLRRPVQAEKVEGIYMLEPYSPNKIPVIMVHGLWSSPMTWMEMFNDLRSLPEIRDHYQFWFYLYPTGRPFWVSAAKLREDLADLQQNLAPEPAGTPLDHMVLVGHSMGGLLSFMQTIESGDAMWRLASNRPFSELKADAAARTQIERVAFFEPNPRIRRVVTIGSPHHGSNFANDYTRWIGQKLIKLPTQMIQASQGLLRDNPGYFTDPKLITISTSIDSLAPDSPIFPFLNKAPRAPWVRYHNIIGLVPQTNFITRLSAGSDGIVSFQSARLADVESELVVPAYHTQVHQHPRSTLEVRRILLEHWAELQFAPLAGTAPTEREAEVPPAAGIERR